MTSIDRRLENILGNIPKELYDIFGTRNLIKLCRLEEAYSRLKKRENIRNAVMQLQKKYGLPLAPNESLTRTTIRARLKLKLKEKQKPFNNNNEDNELV